MSTEITVPDIGDFESVEIIEILVKAGDIIKTNDPIVTLESDKSSVEVPSPFSGKISSLKVKIGDKVSKGTVLASIENDIKKKNIYIEKKKLVNKTVIKK
jgi:pyruvate/2-oxoglutarate dehydrogenase complex dihydrolipoamide acyltransferase (E2) component